jgi:hypothetical protein
MPEYANASNSIRASTGTTMTSRTTENHCRNIWADEYRLMMATPHTSWGSTLTPAPFTETLRTKVRVSGEDKKFRILTTGIYYKTITRVENWIASFIAANPNYETMSLGELVPILMASYEAASLPAHSLLIYATKQEVILRATQIYNAWVRVPGFYAGAPRFSTDSHGNGRIVVPVSFTKDEEHPNFFGTFFGTRLSGGYIIPTISPELYAELPIYYRTLLISAAEGITESSWNMLVEQAILLKKAASEWRLFEVKDRDSGIHSDFYLEILRYFREPRLEKSRDSFKEMLCQKVFEPSRVEKMGEIYCAGGLWLEDE